MRPRVRRRVLVGIAGAAAFGAYAVWVLPLRTILELDGQLRADARALSSVQAENASLSRQLRRDSSVAYQEHLAEQDLGMVPRGSVAFSVLPSSPLYRPIDPVPTAQRSPTQRVAGSARR